MSKRHSLTPEEVTELFSELDDSGVLDPSRVKNRKKRLAARGAATAADGGADAGLDVAARRAHRAIDPLSGADPSGSKADNAISRTALAFIIGILVLVVGMQIWYGVSRRLNTANLSETVNSQTVGSALEGGVEWGNGFTQFPRDYVVEQASENTGIVEVSVVDTDSSNELELFSDSQIQAAALATNALLNDNINRVIYNVSARVDDDGGIVHDSYFDLIPAVGEERTLFTFVWTKSTSGDSTMGWELRIVGLDDEITARIQEQVNSVSSLIEGPGISQDDYEAQQREQELEQRLKGTEIFNGGPSEKSPEEVLESLGEERPDR